MESNKLLQVLNQVESTQDYEGESLVEDLMTINRETYADDYFEKIEKSIDISTIKENVLKEKYLTFRQFVNDFNLLYKNVRQYFGPDSKTATNALKIKQIVTSFELNLSLMEYDIGGSAKKSSRGSIYKKENLKSEIVSSTTTNQKSQRKRASNSVVETEAPVKEVAVVEDNAELYEKIEKFLGEFYAFADTPERNMLTPFNFLPRRTTYPDYYELIPRPISLSHIQRSIRTSQYTNFGQFIADISCLFTNAMTYNHPESVLYLDSKKLLDFVNAHELVDKVDKNTDTQIIVEPHNSTLLNDDLIVDHNLLQSTKLEVEKVDEPSSEAAYEQVVTKIYNQLVESAYTDEKTTFEALYKTYLFIKFTNRLVDAGFVSKHINSLLNLNNFEKVTDSDAKLAEELEKFNALYSPSPQKSSKKSPKKQQDNKSPSFDEQVSDYLSHFNLLINSEDSFESVLNISRVRDLKILTKNYPKTCTDLIDFHSEFTAIIDSNFTRSYMPYTKTFNAATQLVHKLHQYILKNILLKEHEYFIVSPDLVIRSVVVPSIWSQINALVICSVAPDKTLHASPLHFVCFILNLLPEFNSINEKATKNLNYIRLDEFKNDVLALLKLIRTRSDYRSLNYEISCEITLKFVEAVAGYQHLIASVAYINFDLNSVKTELEHERMEKSVKIFSEAEIKSVTSSNRETKQSNGKISSDDYENNRELGYYAISDNSKIYEYFDKILEILSDKKFFHANLSKMLDNFVSMGGDYWDWGMCKENKNEQFVKTVESKLLKTVITFEKNCYLVLKMFSFDKKSGAQPTHMLVLVLSVVSETESCKGLVMTDKLKLVKFESKSVHSLSKSSYKINDSCIVKFQNQLYAIRDNVNRNKKIQEHLGGVLNNNNNNSFEAIPYSTVSECAVANANSNFTKKYKTIKYHDKENNLRYKQVVIDDEKLIKVGDFYELADKPGQVCQIVEISNEESGYKFHTSIFYKADKLSASVGLCRAFYVNEVVKTKINRIIEIDELGKQCHIAVIPSKNSTRAKPILISTKVPLTRLYICESTVDFHKCRIRKKVAVKDVRYYSLVIGGEKDFNDTLIEPDELNDEYLVLRFLTDEESFENELIKKFDLKYWPKLPHKQLQAYVESIDSSKKNRINFDAQDKQLYGELSLLKNDDEKAEDEVKIVPTGKDADNVQQQQQQQQQQGTSVYVCEWKRCNAQFKNLSELKGHFMQSQHHLETKLMCAWNGCVMKVKGRRFKSEEMLEKHVLKRHLSADHMKLRSGSVMDESALVFQDEYTMHDTNAGYYRADGGSSKMLGVEKILEHLEMQNGIIVKLQEKVKKMDDEIFRLKMQSSDVYRCEDELNVTFGMTMKDISRILEEKK